MANEINSLGRGAFKTLFKTGAFCKPLNVMFQILRWDQNYQVQFLKLLRSPKDLVHKVLSTPHLKWKKLSNNSSWDFEHVLDTMDDYWVGQDENFCPESTPTRWRCYHFSKKWSKWKFDATLSIKKPFVTPKFCDRNFSQMHHFEDMNFLSPLDSLYLL